MKNNKEKLFTVGAICSLVLGVLLTIFFVWANIMFGREAKAEGADISVVNIQKNLVYLTWVYAGIAVLTFFRVVQSSYICYKKNHIQRGLIYGIASLLGSQLYYAELNDKIYSETDHTKDALLQKHKPLYGWIALVAIIFMIVGVLWCGQKITGQSIF